MVKHCYSCAAPLNVPEFQGKTENYCINCVDKNGKLRSRNEVKSGLVEWFNTWQPDLDPKESLLRAELYMRAMPAWAN